VIVLGYPAETPMNLSSGNCFTARGVGVTLSYNGSIRERTSLENNDILVWSVAIAVVAFVILCGFLVSLAITARRSLDTARSALQEAKESVEDLQGDVRKLTVNVNEVAGEVREKLQSTDPLFAAVKEVGIMLRELTGTAREATQSLANSIRNQAAAAETVKSTPSWLEWAILSSRLVMSIRKGRNADNEHSNPGGDLKC